MVRLNNQTGKTELEGCFDNIITITREGNKELI